MHSRLAMRSLGGPGGSGLGVRTKGLSQSRQERETLKEGQGR